MNAIEPTPLCSAAGLQFGFCNGFPLPPPRNLPDYANCLLVIPVRSPVPLGTFFSPRTSPMAIDSSFYRSAYSRSTPASYPSLDVSLFPHPYSPRSCNIFVSADTQLFRSQRLLSFSLSLIDCVSNACISFSCRVSPFQLSGTLPARCFLRRRATGSPFFALLFFLCLSTTSPKQSGLCWTSLFTSDGPWVFRFFSPSIFFFPSIFSLRPYTSLFPAFGPGSNGYNFQLRAFFLAQR